MAIFAKKGYSSPVIAFQSYLWKYAQSDPCQRGSEDDSSLRHRPLIMCLHAVPCSWHFRLPISILANNRCYARVREHYYILAVLECRNLSNLHFRGLKLLIKRTSMKWKGTLSFFWHLRRKFVAFTQEIIYFCTTYLKLLRSQRLQTEAVLKTVLTTIFFNPNYYFL